MKYDFDKITDRRGTDSLKWAVGENELPMWVADMDFTAAPEIIAALQKKLSAGVYGYSVIPDRWYGAYIDWWDRRHGLKMEKDWLLFCTGVVPAVSSVIRALTEPGDRIIVQSPVYNAFYRCIEDNGRQTLDNPLIYENGEYRMNLEDLERKLGDPAVRLMILCNPQNPGGNIWDRDTLSKVGELAQKRGVTVLSDEIHCDIARPGMGYVPFASVNDRCRDMSVTCVSPTKAFNLAGLQTSAVCVSDPARRERVKKQMNVDGITGANFFACAAAVAAFDEGGEWLDELREYVFENRAVAERFIRDEIPGLKTVHGDATYLLWIDIRGLGAKSGEFAPFLRETTGLFVSDGAIYGGDGRNFLRMNLACPRAVLEDGMKRLKTGAEEFWDRR